MQIDANNSDMITLFLRLHNLFRDKWYCWWHGWNPANNRTLPMQDFSHQPYDSCPDSASFGIHVVTFLSEAPNKQLDPFVGGRLVFFSIQFHQSNLCVFWRFFCSKTCGWLKHCAFFIFTLSSGRFLTWKRAWFSDLDGDAFLLGDSYSPVSESLYAQLV